MKGYMKLTIVAAALVAANAACDEDTARTCFMKVDAVVEENLECSTVQTQYDEAVKCLSDNSCDHLITAFCQNMIAETCPDLKCGKYTKEDVACLGKTNDAIDAGVENALTAMMNNGADECTYFEIRYRDALQYLKDDKCLVDSAVDVVCSGAQTQFDNFSCKDLKCSKDAFDLKDTDTDSDAPSTASVVASSVVGAIVLQRLL